MSYPTSNTDNEIIAASTTQFDIKKFIFKLIVFLPWIILSLLLSYSVSYLYLRYTPQLHLVSAFILIKDADENSADYKVLRELGVMPGSKEVQNQIDILQSYNIMQGLVDSLHLQIKITTEARIASNSLYGDKSPVFIKFVKGDTAVFKQGAYKLTLWPDKFSLTKSKQTLYYQYNDTIQLDGHPLFFVKNENFKIDPQDVYNVIISDSRSIAMRLRTSIDVRKLHDMGGILVISIQDEVPERAANIINKLIEAFNTAGVSDKNVVGNKTIVFLNDRISAVSRELDEIEVKAEIFKSSNKLGDFSQAATAYLSQALEADNKKAEQTGQIQILYSLENYILNSHQFSDIIPAINGLQEQTLSKLIEQYNEAVLTLQNQSQISTEKDPTIARLQTNLTELKGNLLKNIQSVKSGFNTRLAQIESSQSDFDKILAGIPEKERELIKLKRQIGVKEQLYLYLLQKKEESELSLASNINNTRIVDDAFDQGIVSPQASQIKLFSLLVGLIIPIVAMLLIDFFNNKILDKKQIEEGTRVPIIGEISLDKKVKNIAITTKSRSVLAEQIRLLRTNLRYLAGDKPIQTILVTSFMSGEGKSFLSINLASSLAAGNARVLLLELDLRKPKLAKYLDIQPPYGLTDHLVSQVDFKQVIVHVPELENVDVITSGPIPPNPTELLMSDKMGIFIESIKDKYDYIVFDSSPVGLVADAFSLEKLADTSLFILRHRYSYKTTINYIERLHHDKRFRNIGIVVNGISDLQGVGYGYGYGYGYSYGYGYNYGGSYYEKDNGFLDKMFSLFKK